MAISRPSEQDDIALALQLSDDQSAWEQHMRKTLTVSKHQLLMGFYFHEMSRSQLGREPSLNNQRKAVLKQQVQMDPDGSMQAEAQKAADRFRQLLAMTKNRPADFLQRLDEALRHHKPSGAPASPPPQRTVTRSPESLAARRAELEAELHSLSSEFEAEMAIDEECLQ